MLNLERLRKRRVIDLLRERYPGQWTWNQDSTSWEHESGWSVSRYAELAPQYDGDDDSFATTYRRSDTQERILLL